VSTPSKNDPLHPKAREGIELFNQGKFYEAHEPLEQAWMETDSPERDLCQGILQIGLAYYQISRGNYRGALKMFRRGHRNLASLGDVLLGIDLKRLQKDAQVVETALRQLGPNNTEQLDRELIKPVSEIS
jgi:predicted metal-dependent hydrolase